VRQLVTEALVLCLAGGGLGTGLAFAGVGALVRLDLTPLPRLREVGPSFEALACALALCTITALGLGLVTAARATRETALSTLADGQRGPTGGASRRLLGGLVASQVGAALALLVGAGLLGRSLLRVLEVDPGFRTGNVMAMDVSLPGEASPASRVSFLEAVTGRLLGLPGVRAAGLVNSVPLGGGGANGTFLIVDQDIQDPRALEALFKDKDRTGYAEFRVASAGYFPALGVPLRRGRLFEASDGPEAPHVAVVSESFARDLRFSGDALGRRIQFGNMDGDLRTFTIIGMVGDVREAGLEATPRPILYASHRQRPRMTTSVTFVVHTEGDPAALVPPAREIVRALDPELPARFRTMAELRAATLADRRLTLGLLGTFAAAALALAILGIYGVASYSVAQRTREVGVRMALGAEPGRVLRMVLAESGRPVALGAALGLAIALGLGRSLAALLYEVEPGDPLTMAGVTLALGAAALGAAFLPARRATRIDPAVALRSD
jgi:predicted permease